MDIGLVLLSVNPISNEYEKKFWNIPYYFWNDHFNFYSCVAYQFFRNNK